MVNTVTGKRATHPGVAQAGDLIPGARANSPIVLLAEEIAALGTTAENTTSRRISGGQHAWLSGFTFVVAAASYQINGVTYNSPETEITLDAADPTNPRIDVLALTTSSTVVKVTGTAAADPAKPEVNPDTQLELTFVVVSAGTTEPDGVAALLLYGENAGDPTEWDAIESTAAARIELANIIDPYAGTNAILFNGALAADFVTLTAGAGNELNIGNMTSFEMHVKSIVWANPKRLRVAFFNSADRISNWVEVQNGSFGFDSSNVVDYQTIIIPPSNFSFTDVSADSVRLEVQGGGSALQAYADQVRTQSGLTIINNFGLTEDQLVNNLRQYKALQYYEVGDLVAGVNVSWDTERYPTAYLKLSTSGTLDFPATIRAGAVYELEIEQADAGNETLAFAAGFIFTDGAPTIPVTADSVSLLTFKANRNATALMCLSALDFS